MSLTKVSYAMITGAPINVLDYGADPTGTVDSTAAIEAAFTQTGAIYFPSGTYLYAPSASTGFLSNTMIFGDGATSIIKYKPLTNPIWTDIQQVLRPRAYANVENVVIQNITIDGNRDGVNWSGVTLGDGNAFGIALWGTQNVIIDNVTVKNCWTDGYYLAYTHPSIGTRRQCQNVRIGTIYAENCGRQGMSITSAQDVIIDSFYVNGVDRTGPGAAIDMEPDNSSPDSINNITIGQIIAKDVWSGVSIAGVSPVYNISIGSIDLQNVSKTIGIIIKRARNISIGQATVQMTNNDYYGLYAIDYNNVYIGQLNVLQGPGATGSQGGVLLDVQPFEPPILYNNTNFRIDNLYLNGAKGNGFDQRYGSASIGYSKIEDAGQNGTGTTAYYIAGTCSFDYAVANSLSAQYAVWLGSNNVTFTAGDFVSGTSGTLNLSGYRANFGSAKVNGQPYQNNFYSGIGSPEGVVTANPGALYFNASGGAGTTLYVKQSGVSNTGWVGK